MKKQAAGWGYGKEIYKSFNDFPSVIQFKGEDWYKMYECRTTNTEMLSAEYYADLDDDSRRTAVLSTHPMHERSDRRSGDDYGRLWLP